MNQPHIFVDASPLTKQHLSGVSHYTLGIIMGFDNLAAEGKLTYSLFVPIGTKSTLNQFGFKHYKKIVMNPFLPKVLRQLIKRQLCPPLDILFGRGNYYFPDFLAWPLTRRSRSVVVIHDMAFKAVPDTIMPKNRDFLEKVVPQSLKNADKVITVSNFSKSEIQKYYKVPADKISVIYPAVNRGIFYPKSARDTQITTHRLGIKGKFILSVGNIEPRKNYSALIRAYCALPARIKKIYSLVIVGAEGWNNQQIMQEIASAQAKGESIIMPKSFVKNEELADLYSGCSLFALLSLYEGFGMQVLEALGCGAQVITSNVASLSEAGGPVTTQVNPEDLSEISDAIIKTLTNKRPTQQSRQRIDEHLSKFSWQQAAARTAQLVINVR